MSIKFYCDECRQEKDCDITICRSCYDELESKKECLEEDYDQLMTEFETLKKAYDELKAAHNAPIMQFARGELKDETKANT